MIKIDEKVFIFTLEDYARVMMEVADEIDALDEEPDVNDKHQELSDIVKMFLIMANTAIEKANFPAKTVFVNTMN